MGLGCPLLVECAVWRQTFTWDLIEELTLQHYPAGIQRLLSCAVEVE